MTKEPRVKDSEQKMPKRSFIKKNMAGRCFTDAMTDFSRKL